MVIDRLRHAIGIGSLALTTGAGKAMIRFHTDSIRIPMIMLALFRVLLDPAILTHSRHLHYRPGCAMADRFIESRPDANRTSPNGSVSVHSRFSPRKSVRITASQLGALALAGHYLVESRMQTLTEADREFEDLVVGRQDQDIAR